MKKKILSLLLAFALVFSVFIPVNILPETKIVADAAEGIYPYNVYDSEVHVGTFEELKTAVENAIDNQIIILDTDISAFSDHPNITYGNLIFKVEGTVAIDLNGCNINLGGSSTSYAFRIEGATKLHIMNSRIDENESTISYNGKKAGRSAFEVANTSAELFVYEGIELVLEERTGAETTGDPAVIRVRNIKRLDLFCKISALSDESNGIVFEKLKGVNTFADSDIYIRGAIDEYGDNAYIKAHGSCIKFVSVNPINDGRTLFDIKIDTFNTFNLGCDLKKKDSNKLGPMISVGGGSDLKVEDMALAGGSFRLYAASTSDTTASSTIKFFGDESGYSVKYNSSIKNYCSHNSEYNEEQGNKDIKLLSTPLYHIDICGYCKSATIRKGHDMNSEMACDGCELNTLNTEKTVPVIDEVIEVGTYPELFDALRSNKSEITIRLKQDITNFTAESINLSVFGNVILDLNGHTIYVDMEDNMPLFRIEDNYCNNLGALNFVITNLSSTPGLIRNHNKSIVHLSDENASLTVFRNVTLFVDEGSTTSDAPIQATVFNELNLFNECKIENVVGHGILFDNTSEGAYRNSSVDISECNILSKEANISFEGSAFKKSTLKKFSLGMAMLDTYDVSTKNLQIFECAVNSDVKWTDIIKHWNENEENRGYILYGDGNNLIGSAADDAAITKEFGYSVMVGVGSSYDNSSDCSAPINTTVMVSGNTVYAYCEICGRFDVHTVEAGAYESPDCATEGKIEHFRCVDNNCGVYFSSEYTGLTAEDIILPKHSSTVLSDWQGLPQVFPECVATCTDPGLPEDCYYCFVCENYVSPDGRIVVEIPASHELDFVKATVTCKQAGTIDHYHCSVCLKNFRDAEAKNELASIDCNPNLSFYHKFDSNPETEADCNNYGIKYKHGTCEHCDKLIVMIPGKFGTFSYEVFDEAKHITPAGHSTVFVKAKSEDCTNDGNIEHYKCSACGKTFKEEAAINEIADVSIKAKHILSKIGAQKESCTVNGNIEHYKCSRCEKTYSDAAGKKAITDITVKATGHSYEWVVTKPAEVGVQGEKTYKCKVCGDVKETQKIDALEPEYILGDVDMNGELKAADARLVLRASVGLETLNATQKKAADADKNGEIKAADARLILRASVGLETLK